MKRILNFVLVLFLIIILSGTSFSQQMNQEKKGRFISYLSENYNDVLLEVLTQLADSNVVEAVPEIRKNIWRYDQFKRFLAIRALYKLNYTDAHRLALVYIDSVEVGKPDSYFSKLALQSMTNRILFEMGDYSQSQYTINYVKSISPEIDKSEISLLEEIVKNVPSDSEVAKNLLINTALNCKNSLRRWIATSVLVNHFGMQTIDTAIKVFEYDNDRTNRGIIISEIFSKYKSDQIHNSLLKQTSNEKNAQNLSDIAEELLSKYGYANDYRVVKELQSKIPDSLYSGYIQLVLLNKFKSHKPIPSSSRIENIDTLISYNNQSNSFNWLGNTTFSDQIKQYLVDAKTKLISGDSLGTALKIKQYQSAIVQALQEPVTNTNQFVTTDGYRFLYYYPKYILERLPKLPTTKFIDSQGKLIKTGSLQYYEGAWKDAVNNNDGTFTVPTIQKTITLKMNYEYGSQQKNNVTISADTVVFQTTNVQVKLQNSLGAVIDTGKVQYYAGAWREFGSTANGIAAKELLPGSYSFRITYSYASLDKTQDVSINSNVIFQTVPATVQLKNSTSSFIDQGTVQYYSGAWRDLGVTTNGVVTKELLPISYSFRMNYAFASLDKTQNIGTNATVVFQTVPATVQLKNSAGNFIDQGTVQYYSGAWRDLGATTNGVFIKELLPNSYSFRMNYAFASLDKTQNVGTNATVVFQTVPASVQLKNSANAFIDQGIVQYYSGTWRDFGITTNGVVVKELLPNNYSFRMTHEYVSLDKTQNVGTNNVVLFNTVLARVSVTDNLNQLVNNAMVSYYSGTWRQIGNTTNGVITKELLPISLSFRAALGTKQVDKTQNIGTNNNIDLKLP